MTVLTDLNKATARAASSGVAGANSSIMDAASILDKNSFIRDDYQGPKFGQELASDLAGDDVGAAKMAANKIKVYDNIIKHFESRGERVKKDAGSTNTGTVLGPVDVLDTVGLFYRNQIAHHFTELQVSDRELADIYTVQARFSSSDNGADPTTNAWSGSQNLSAHYSSETTVVTVGTGDGSAKAFTATLTRLPVRTTNGATITMSVNNGAAVNLTYNPADNSLAGTGLSTGSGDNSLNPTTGAIKLTFSTAPTSGHTIVITYRYNSEEDTENVRKMFLDIGRTSVRCEPHPIVGSWSNYAATVASSGLTLDIVETIKEMIGSQLATDRDRLAAQHIINSATTDSELDISFATSGRPISLQDIYSELGVRITDAGNKINAANGRGLANYVMVGANGVKVAQALAGFVPTKQNPKTTVGGNWLIGHTADGAPVVKSSLLGDNDYIVGFKGMQEGDAGVIFVDFLPLFATGPLQEGHLYGNMGMLSSYGFHTNPDIKYAYKGTMSF